MYRIKSNHALYKMKMLSQLGTDRPVTDQLLELLEWLFATKNSEILVIMKRNVTMASRTFLQIISIERIRRCSFESFEYAFRDALLRNGGVMGPIFPFKIEWKIAKTFLLTPVLRCHFSSDRSQKVL